MVFESVKAWLSLLFFGWGNGDMQKQLVVTIFLKTTTYW